MTTDIKGNSDPHTRVLPARTGISLTTGDEPTFPDAVDDILEQWALQRPDLNLSAMSVLARIARLVPVINERLAESFGDSGLDFPSFDVLSALRRSGEPYEQTPSQLAESMMVTAGAVTQRLVRLEEQGLVTRTHNKTDRRKVIVALTWRGVRVIDNALVQHARQEEAILSLFTDEERAQFTGYLRRLLVFLSSPDHKG
ncbi:MAG: MarR family transcriptional regulator [Propionibacteriaceae bacterium]|nr:MarR family transcriptional regulator [Propionibacteriaceae bacterium]